MKLLKVTTPEGISYVVVNNEEELNAFVKGCGYNPLAVYVTEIMYYDLRSQ